MNLLNLCAWWLWSKNPPSSTQCYPQSYPKTPVSETSCRNHTGAILGCVVQCATKYEPDLEVVKMLDDEWGEGRQDPGEKPVQKIDFKLICPASRSSTKMQQVLMRCKGAGSSEVHMRRDVPYEDIGRQNPAANLQRISLKAQSIHRVRVRTTPGPTRSRLPGAALRRIELFVEQSSIRHTRMYWFSLYLVQLYHDKLALMVDYHSGSYYY